MTEPKTISELMTLVMEESKKGNTNNAIIYLNEAIEIEPNDVRFYISRGTFKEHKNCEDAIEDYTKAIEIDTNYHFAYFNRARVKCKLGDYQGAIEDYSKIIEINPNHPYAYPNRARVKCKLGDYQGAIDDYTKAIKIDPNNAYLYNYRAESKRKLGDNEGADEDDRKAEKLKNIF